MRLSRVVGVLALGAAAAWWLDRQRSETGPVAGPSPEPMPARPEPAAPAEPAPPEPAPPEPLAAEPPLGATVQRTRISQAPPDIPDPGVAATVQRPQVSEVSPEEPEPESEEPDAESEEPERSNRFVPSEAPTVEQPAVAEEEEPVDVTDVVDDLIAPSDEQEIVDAEVVEEPPAKRPGA